MPTVKVPIFEPVQKGVDAVELSEENYGVFDDSGNPRFQAVDLSYLVATLTKAIQELKAKVEALEA